MLYILFNLNIARFMVVGSVCPCFNSLLDCLFVPQTIQSTESVTTISLIEPFFCRSFLNKLHCRDLSAASIVRIQTVGHFHSAVNACALFLPRVGSCPLERRRRRCEVKSVLTIMSPSKFCPQCQASVPLKLKVCKSCQHVFRSKRKSKSLSDRATKRMSVKGH